MTATTLRRVILELQLCYGRYSIPQLDNNGMRLVKQLCWSFISYWLCMCNRIELVRLPVSTSTESLSNLVQMQIWAKFLIFLMLLYVTITKASPHVVSTAVRCQRNIQLHYSLCVQALQALLVTEAVSSIVHNAKAPHGILNSSHQRWLEGLVSVSLAARQRNGDAT